METNIASSIVPHFTSSSHDNKVVSYWNRQWIRLISFWNSFSLILAERSWNRKQTQAAWRVHLNSIAWNCQNVRKWKSLGGRKTGFLKTKRNGPFHVADLLLVSFTAQLFVSSRSRSPKIPSRSLALIRKFTFLHFFYFSLKYFSYRRVNELNLWQVADHKMQFWLNRICGMIALVVNVNIFLNFNKFVS